MRPAPSLEAFLADPVGRCFVGRSFVYFHPRADFNGFRLAGEPDERDAAELLAVLDVTRRPSTRPYVSLVDTSPMRHIREAFFARMVEYQASRMPTYAALIRRQAMVRPQGMRGAVVAGFYRLVAPTFPVEVFDDAAAALAWLGVPDAAAFLDDLEAVGAHALGEPAPLVRAMRQALGRDLERPSPASVARALGVSPRTLQRRLREAGTSFQVELGRARIEAAQALMLAGETKLTAIALEVGCSSLPHFSTLFRRITGETPSAWRARRRG